MRMALSYLGVALFLAVLPSRSLSAQVQDLDIQQAQTALANSDCESAIKPLTYVIMGYRDIFGSKAPLWWMLGQRAACYNKLGRPDEALLDLDVAFQEFDKESAQKRNASERVGDGALWSVRAEALRRLGRYEEAMSDVDRALRAQPNWPPFQASRASILHSQGKTAEAISVLDRELNLRPDYYGYYQTRAEIYEANGDMERARSEYAQACQFLSTGRNGLKNVVREKHPACIKSASTSPP